VNPVVYIADVLDRIDKTIDEQPRRPAARPVETSAEAAVATIFDA